MSSKRRSDRYNEEGLIEGELIIIRHIDEESYELAQLELEPMKRHQLTPLLIRGYQIPIPELAIMYVEFKLNPSANTASFNRFGEFSRVWEMP